MANTPMSTASARLTGRNTTAERIEQAIARGLTATRICDALGVSAEDVHAVWDRLDTLDDDPDDDRPPPYTWPAYSKALADELVTVASNAASARLRRSLTEQIVDTPRSPDCGSHAAYVRHHHRWEPIDPLCRLAERTYRNRIRAGQRRAKRAERPAA